MNKAEEDQFGKPDEGRAFAKDRVKLFKIFLLASSLAGVHSTLAQNPVITSFSNNGTLVCSNLNPNSVAAVEWASSAAGPWQGDWASLGAIRVGTNRTIQASVPMFYRVRGIASTNSAPSGMALIPAGSFTLGDVMGDGYGDSPPTNVFVSAFYIDTNLVSYSQWLAVYSYATNHGYAFQLPGSGKTNTHPVQAVDWYGAAKWCNARSQQAGLTPVYYANSTFTQLYTNGYSTTNGFFGTNVYANWSANGYRLPTEAEWEKAARGGVAGQRFPWGNTITWSNANYYSSKGLQIGDRTYDLAPYSAANPMFNDGVQPYTSPVGFFAPNGYGLFDMCGNVVEWCWDWYGAATGSAYLGGTDPHGPASGSSRVARGGSYFHYPYQCTCAVRFALSPSYAQSTVGFRCVRRAN